MTDEKPTYEQLEKRLRLAEMSVNALRLKLRRVSFISNNRMKRLNAAKLKIAEYAKALDRLISEAHGGS